MLPGRINLVVQAEQWVACRWLRAWAHELKLELLEFLSQEAFVVIIDIDFSLDIVSGKRLEAFCFPSVQALLDPACR